MFVSRRLFIPVFCLFMLMTDQTAFSQTMTTEQWREDLTFLTETLRKVHPNPFHRAPATEFEAVRQALYKDIPDLEAEEIVVRMIGLTALMHDGHTSLGPQNGLKLDLWYPVRFKRFEDGIYIIAADRTQEALVGSRVLRIAGRPAVDIWDDMQDISAGDNIFSRMARVPLYMAMPEVFKGLHINEGKRLALTVQTVSGERQSVSLEPIPASGSRWLYGFGAPGDDSVTWMDTMGADRDLPFQHNTDRYWYQIDASTGMLYAQINAVLNTDQPVFLNGERRALSLTAFSEEILKQMDQGRARTLVIDIRNNGGGNNFLARPLVDGIVARPEVNRKGQLFVITGRRTYSAAMNLTSMLESRTAALFVGEPPGGAPHHYGDATGFTLPHSGMSVNVSTLHWDLGVEPADVREMMEPQMAVAPRFNDLKDGRDPALAAIQQYKQNDVPADHMLEVYKAEGIAPALNVFLNRKPPAAPWSSQVQQLIAFGYKIIGVDGSGEDIYRAFRFATEQYPEAPEAWFHLGRVYAYPGRWEEAAEAYRNANKLQPMNDLIRRMYEAAQRK